MKQNYNERVSLLYHQNSECTDYATYFPVNFYFLTSYLYTCTLNIKGKKTDSGDRCHANKSYQTTSLVGFDVMPPKMSIQRIHAHVYINFQLVQAIGQLSSLFFVPRLFEEKRRDIVFGFPSFRPSVLPTVRPSFRPSVRPSVLPSPYRSMYLVCATPPTVLFRFF